MPRPKAPQLDDETKRSLKAVAMQEKQALDERAARLEELHGALAGVLEIVDRQIAALMVHTIDAATSGDLVGEVRLYALRGMRLGVEDGRGPFEELASLERFRGDAAGMLERCPMPSTASLDVVDELLQNGELGRFVAGRTPLRAEVAESVGVSESTLDKSRAARSPLVRMNRR